jgi:hypothetical protein
VGNFLSSLGCFSFSGRTLLHGESDVRIHCVPCHSIIMAWVTRLCATDFMKDMKPTGAPCTAGMSENKFIILFTRINFYFS